jgi:hypothetical protein
MARRARTMDHTMAGREKSFRREWRGRKWGVEDVSISRQAL